MRKLVFILASAFVGAASGGANAQVFNSVDAGGGISWSMESVLNFDQSGVNYLNLGAPVSSSTTPLMFNYSGGSGQISFSGSALMNYSSSTGGNQLIAGSGTTRIDFSTQQKFFTMRWGSVDSTNVISFYNGTNLLYSLTGAQALAASGNVQLGTYSAAFNFAETGFTRVTMSSPGGGGLEAWNVGFSNETVAVAPIPLSAASFGGFLSFLMMLGLQGGRGRLRLVQAPLVALRRRGRQQAHGFA